MSYHPCVSGCGRSLAPQDGHDHCLTCLGIQHAEEAFVDGSCSSCGDMTISELRNRLRCVKHGGVPLPLPRSGVRPGTKRGGTASGGVRGDLRITVRASPSGGSHPSGTPQPAGVPLVRTGASAEWGTPPVSFGASPDDQMSVAASEGEPSLSGDDDSAALPPSGVVALSEPDPEMTAMLSRAAENVGLVWYPPPRPDPSRLDEWFLGGGRAGFQRPPPVPFFPEVHEELTRSWKAPFTARNKPCGSSPLTTLDGGAALGYTGIPSVERSVAMQLCPTVASTLRGEPCLPSRACKYSSGLTGSAYRACGEAASALHAMALLQVHQAKALRDLHEGGHDLAVLHELRAAVVDLLCVARSYRLPYRKDQEVYTGRWKGQLLWRFGRDPNSSVIRRDSEWPTERERLGYVCNPRSLREGTETSRPVATVAVPPLGGRVSGSAPQRKHD